MSTTACNLPVAQLLEKRLSNYSTGLASFCHQ